MAGMMPNMGSNRQINLINGVSAIFGTLNKKGSPEVDIGGVASPRGIVTPTGTRSPRGVTGKPKVVWPSKPSKDAIERGRKKKPTNNFAR
jgi:hypothetical protein